MDLKLKGQLALVTGSTSGIGKGIATALLKEGARVVVNSFSKQEIDSARDELSAIGDTCFMIADITNTESVNQMMNDIYEIGELDIIVNNVGFWQSCEFENISDDGWQRMMDLNFYGAVRTLRACFPRMIKRNYGRIVNISSEVAMKPLPDFIHYSVAKTAVVALSRGLAEAARGTNVTVNSLLPGPTWTPGEQASQTKLAEESGKTVEEQVAEFFREEEPSSLAERFLDIEEIANAVTFYCSPLASGATGSSIRIDGGIVRHI